MRNACYHCIAISVQCRKLLPACNRGTDNKYNKCILSTGAIFFAGNLLLLSGNRLMTQKLQQRQQIYPITNSEGLGRTEERLPSALKVHL